MKLKRIASLVLAATLVGGGVGLSAPAAQAADTVTTIDEAVLGTGLGQFEYSTGWGVSTNLNTAQYVGGTEHWTNPGTPTVTFRFSGTGVRILGVKAANHGIYGVSVDGGPESLVDGYASARTYKAVLFESAALTDGQHTVTFRVTGTKNAASTGTGASLDAAEVLSPAPTAIVGGIVDDATYTGPHRFAFGPGWTAGQGHSTNDFNAGTEHWAKPANNPSFTFTFTGVAATLHGVTAPAHGIYGVSVDGAPETLVDGSSVGRLTKQQFFSTGLLPYGEHTIALRLTGTKSPTATGADGEIDFATVYTENVPVSAVEMDTAPLALLEGQELALQAQVAPATAFERGIRWSSSDSAVAAVSASGMVTALATGAATITATSVDGGKTATRAVTVKGLGSGLNGAVGDTNFHYVTKKTFNDYQRKYFEDAVQMTASKWSATGWRADRVNGQFVLWAGTAPQTGITVEATELAGPDGAKIATENITLDFLRSVKAGQGNPSAGKPQESIPDILNGTAPVNLAARSVQGVWMTVDVPSGTPAGHYTGTVTAKSAEGQSVKFDLDLEVLALELPEASKWEQFVDLWQNPYAIARVEGISSDKLFTKPHFDAMRPYYEMLADGGQDVITATVVADPWASQTYDKYGSMVKWTKTSAGTWKFDFTDFDAWVEYMIDDIGIDGQIDAYSMVNWASRILYFDEATNKNINAQVNVGTPIWKEMWGAFLEEFGPHLKEKGWFDRTYMAMDERALNDIIAAVDLIKIKAPGLKTGAAMNYNSLGDTRIDRIEKISLGSYYVDLGDASFKAVADHRKELGLITSVYSCVGHFPNTFTRSNPAEGNWVQWKTVATGSDGYLRWAFDSFVSDPFATTDFKTWESGDTAQIYPGALSSVRWERLTEGVRDAEKVRILSAANPAAKTQLDTLMATMKNPGYKSDPYGGRIDPGVVNIPAAVDGLRAGLTDVARNYAASLPVPVASVGLNESTLNLEVGKSAALAASVLPSNASNQAVTWKSSDADVATVVGDGAAATVKAVGAGTATVTVTSVDGSRTATATVKVTKPKPDPEPTATPTPEPTATPTNTPKPGESGIVVKLPGGPAFVAGSPTQINVSSLKPGSEVIIELHSEPVELARGLASSTGTFTATVLIPRNTPAGEHHIVVTSTDAAGVTGTSRTAVSVSAAGTAPGGSGGSAAGSSPSGLASTGPAFVWSFVAFAAFISLLGLVLMRRGRRVNPVGAGDSD